MLPRYRSSIARNADRGEHPRVLIMISRQVLSNGTASDIFRINRGGFSLLFVVSVLQLPVIFLATRGKLTTANVGEEKERAPRFIRLDAFYLYCARTFPGASCSRGSII